MKKTEISAEKYFRRYLQMGPIALALWRSVEARHMAEIPLKRPILDIGCGFGEFAEPLKRLEEIVAKTNK